MVQSIQKETHRLRAGGFINDFTLAPLQNRDLVSVLQIILQDIQVEQL